MYNRPTGADENRPSLALDTDPLIIRIIQRPPLEVCVWTNLTALPEVTSAPVLQPGMRLKVLSTVDPDLLLHLATLIENHLWVHN